MILLAEAVLVYPTAEIWAGSPNAIMGWLERERVSVAFMAAATWNRLAAAFGRKPTRPQRARLIITEGAPNEGTFGRVSMRARRRIVIDPVGTVALARRTFPGAARLRVVESGFDKVPKHRRDEAFRMNEGGWEEQMRNIARHVRQAA